MDLHSLQLILNFKILSTFIQTVVNTVVVGRQSRRATNCKTPTECKIFVTMLQVSRFPSSLSRTYGELAAFLTTTQQLLWF